MLSATPVLSSQAILSEGPVWWHNRLWWVEIERGEVHAFDPATGHDQCFPAGQKIGTLVPQLKRRELLVARTNDLAWLDPMTGTWTPQPGWDVVHWGERANDGKCDPRGRFWFGTKDETGAARGGLHILEPDGTCRRVLEGLQISNGLDWDEAGGRFFHIDTPTRRIDVYSCDLDTGSITNGRPFVICPEAWGWPDGMTLDAEGNLWVAFFAGAAVRCLDGQTGALRATIELPVPYVTSCGFGGDDLGTLYITTSHRDHTPEERQRYPLAGDIFACRPGVYGRPVRPFVG